MKTVSTKLENSDFERFQEMCNDDGQCASEWLRDVIKDHINAFDDYKSSKEESKPVAQGKITKVSYDDGKTWNDVSDNSDKPVWEVEI